ncbi:MAG: GNAT family N-acetyltransferase [Bacteroidales bacterium]|nr:GNAT family N-acetyltransferase [Bacteroidales bacterium]
MIRLYDLTQSEEWDVTVRSFKEYDVYYLSGYVKAFQIHGDGDPYLLYYEAEGLRAIYVYMKRKTAIEGYYDSVTPYGYGGVLFEGDTTEEKLLAFWVAYVAKMKEEGIVDNFVRYHPVLANAVSMKSISTVIDLGKTIAFDLASPEVIWENIISKNRNMIRKAEKNGITIEHGKGMDLLDKFTEIYNATMDKDHAEEYYYFKRPFYESIDQDLQDNYEMFYAMYEGRPIAMSIMIFANGRLNYHLSGSDIAYRNLAPSNLLLYKAALWGYEQGCKTFHLGGGVGSGEDNLYKFKAAFNKNSDYQFSIGKEIFDHEKYDELVALRASTDAEFNSESKFFPLYRS